MHVQMELKGKAAVYAEKKDSGEAAEFGSILVHSGVDC